MTKSGSSVLEDIQRQISTVKKKAGEYSSNMSSCERKISSLSSEREQCVAQLAEFYLPELDSKTLQESSRDIHVAAQKFYDQKLKRHDELEKLMFTSNEKIDAYTKKASDIVTKLNAKASERDAAYELMVKAIECNPERAGIFAKVSQLEEQQKRDLQRISEMQEDAKKKLPAYEADPLFTYLVNRAKFGTKEYSGSGIIKTLDEWVAKMDNFEENFRNCSTLMAMPEIAQQVADQRKEELDSLQSRLKSIQEESEEFKQYNKLMAQGAKLEQDRAENQKQTEAERATYASYSQELSDMRSTKDKYHKLADSAIENLLSGESIQKLKDRAKKTPDPRDDQIVARMEAIDEKICSLKENSREYQREKSDWDSKLKGLEGVESKFTSNNYESSRSNFDSGFDINSFLTGYMAGNYSSSTLWNNIEENQNTEPAPVYHSSYSSGGYGSSSRSSDSDSSSSSSSSSGWGFGSSSSSSSSYSSYDSGSSSSFSSCDSGGGSSFSSCDSG